MFWRRKHKQRTEVDDYTVEPMEPRVLLSADALGVDAGVLDQGDNAESDWDLQDAHDWTTPLANHDTAESASLSTEEHAVDERVEIVFLDAGVEDGQELLADLMAREDVSISQVHLLNSNSDGVDQIAQVLAGQQGIDAVHIISHGAAGQVQLGSGTLSTGSLDGYAGQLNDWGSALADSGDILIYGCDLAADEQGEALVDAIGILTGADVAASVDQTGHSSQGADWELEYRVGEVDVATFSPGAFPVWQGTLAIIAYEGFDYSAGALEGANGGTGWASAWTTAEGTSAMVAATGLTSPDGSLPVEGATAEMNTTMQFSQNRDLGSALGADGTTAWVSFLLKADGVAGGGMSLELADGTDDQVTIGYNNDDFLITKDRSILGAVYINDVVTDQQTYLMVAKLDFMSGNDTITLYVDPTPGLASPDSAATAQFTTADLGSFTQIAIMGGFADNNSSIDEIRVGDTFTDVTPFAGYLDRFDTSDSFAGDHGTLSWTNDWQEIGEANGAAMGNVSVWDEVGEQGLYLWAADNVGAWRQADLSGATTATLDFGWAMTNTESGDQASLQISTDGVVWDTLDTFDGPLNHGTLQSVSYDISAYIDNDTRIRFETVSGFSANDVFFVDNVRIALDANAVPTLNGFGGPVTSGDEDTEITVTFGTLVAQGDEADADGTVDAFVIKTVTSGTLRIGSSAGTATAWVAGSNDTLDATKNAYWTPAADADGTQNAFTVVARDNDAAESSNDVTVQVTVNAVNDAPTLTASASDPTFTEGGAASGLFSAASADTVEVGQTLGTLVLTVTNVVDGGNEVLNIDGNQIALADGTSGTTTDNGLLFNVSVIGSTATVTLSGGTLSSAQAETLVDTMSYQHNSGSPTVGDRTVTLTRLVDSGGTANGGVDTATLNIASTVTVEAAGGAAPVLGNNAISIGQGGGIVLDGSMLSATDADNADAGLTFNVSGVRNGWFALISDTTTAITNFDQSDVTAGNVAFIHDGGELAPSYHVSVSDGSNSTAAASATVAFSETGSGVLWLSTDGDVGGSNGVPGLDAGGWDKGDILQQAGPNLAYGEAATDGTFSIAFDPSNFGTAADINGMHFVTGNITIGASNAISLQAGDLLLTTGSNKTFTSNGAAAPADLSVDKEDIFYFRPDSPGDYSVGNFYQLLSDPFQDGAEVRGMTLVEKDVTVGDVALSAGDLLLSRSGGAEDNDIWLLQTATLDPTVGGSYPAAQRLIEGDDPGVDIEHKIFGLELIETDISGGGQDYDAGTILLTLDADDGDVGLTSTSVDEQDIVALQVNKTTLGSGAGNAQVIATLMFDGDDVSGIDVNIDSDDEALDGLTLTVAPGSGNVAPSLDSSTLVVDEGQTVTLTAAMLSASDPNDADGGLVFTVSSVSGGQFELAGTPGVAVTSFTQAQIDAGDVLFVDDGDEVAPSFDVEVTDGALSDGPVTATINFTNVNDEQVLAVNTGTTVLENSTGTTITSAMLDTTDDDNTAVQVIYTLTGVPGNGTLYLSGTPLIVGNSFTQYDVDNSRVTYDHDGTETTSDSFGFSVDDGAGTAMTGTFSITVTPQNDEQVLAVNTGTTVLENSTGTTITSTMLDTTDVDNTAVEVIYTLTGVPGNGTLYLSGTPLIVGNSFTQDDVDNSRVTYDHDGTETTSDSFGFSVDDGAGTATTGTFSITVTPQNDNDPLADDESFTVAEGGTATEADLDAGTSLLDGDTDADLPGDSLTVNTTPVVDVSHGSLTLNSDGTFSYVHDGTENFTDGFTYEVDDGAGGTDTATVTITITPQNDNSPVLDNPMPDQSAIEDMAFSFQFASNTFSDPDSGDSLAYTARQASGAALPAWLSFDGATRTFAGTPLNADVGTLNVEVMATDGTGAIVTDAFDLTIANVNDAPVLGNNQMTLKPGDTVVLTPSMLAASDVDHAAGDLQFTVSSVSGGQFELTDDAGVAITSFTQAQVAAGDVVFVDDGDNVAPAYSVTVDDTVVSTGPAAATITFNLPTVTTTTAAVTPTPAPEPEPPPALPTPEPAAAAEPEPEPELEPEPEPEPVEEVTEEVISGDPLPPTTATDTGEDSLAAVTIPDFDAGAGTGSVGGLLKGLLVRPAALTAMAMQQSLPGAFEVDVLAREVRDVLASSEFNSSMDRMREDVSDSTIFHHTVVGSSVAVTTGLSVGYVAWLVRGGVLLSTALSSLPAWQFIDPLPILARTRDGDDADGREDSLQSIIKEESERAANKAREAETEIVSDDVLGQDE